MPAHAFSGDVMRACVSAAEPQLRDMAHQMGELEQLQAFVNAEPARQEDTSVERVGEVR